MMKLAAEDSYRQLNLAFKSVWSKQSISEGSADGEWRNRCRGCAVVAKWWSERHGEGFPLATMSRAVKGKLTLGVDPLLKILENPVYDI